MGLIGNILGLGRVAREVAEVFVPNKTQRQSFEHEEHTAALTQYGQEFRVVQEGMFNSFINGLNRLPRPILALGTVGLFVFSMTAPDAFSQRMQGLATVPHELWWLLGAIVSFYFGARELHYQRRRRPSGVADASSPPSGLPSDYSDEETEDNPAISQWRNAHG